MWDFHVGFARPVHYEAGLVEQLREWLPELRRIHLIWKTERSSKLWTISS